MMHKVTMQLKEHYSHNATSFSSAEEGNNVELTMKTDGTLDSMVDCFNAFLTACGFASKIKIDEGDE